MSYDNEKKLDAAKQLLDELKEQFELEKEKIRKYRLEIYRERDFKVSKFYFYNGPNYYLNCKAMVFNLFIAPSGDSVQFYKEQVVKVFPKIAEKETPFVVDLFAEVLLTILKMDIDLFIKDFSIGYDGDEYVIAIDYLDPKISKEAAFMVSKWFKAMSDDYSYDIMGEFIKLQAKFDKTIFGGPTIYSLVEAGWKQKIPVIYLYEENQFMWGYGKKQLRGRSTTFHTDGIKDTEFTMYKDMVGEFLEACGFPTPLGVNCFTEEEILEEAKKIGFPCVVKPVAGHKGQGVTTNIQSLDEVKKAFQKIVESAKAEGVNFDGALIQKQIFGTDHRLLSVGGKFVAALERVPAYVDGNGVDNIRTLIEIENQKEIRLDNARSPLCKIKIDDNLIEFLQLQNLTLDSVPAQGERITLRRVANISAGGVSINVTDKIHPLNVQLVEDIAGYFSVKCLGIDVLAGDISKPWTEGNFGIIEINAGPGVFMHLAPAYGGSIDVPKYIMQTHFPRPEYGRIPIIIGNKLTRQFANILNNRLHQINPNIFFASLTEDGVYFNERYFFKNKCHEQNIKNILRNPKTEIALFNHTKDDIYDDGLLHEGADIVILDEPSYAEDITLRNQLLPGSLLIEIEGNEMKAFRDGNQIDSWSINQEEKPYKILEMIETHLSLGDLMRKYE